MTVKTVIIYSHGGAASLSLTESNGCTSNLAQNRTIKLSTTTFGNRYDSLSCFSFYLDAPLPLLLLLA